MDVSITRNQDMSECAIRKKNLLSLWAVLGMVLGIKAGGVFA